MIKAVITDVDGVIIGNKKGFNFPTPTVEVLHAFKILRTKNIPVVFCTGKASYVIETLIQKTGFNNPHIGDGGTLIFNPITNEIVKKHVLEKDLVKEIVRACVKNKIHVSVNTVSDTFVDSSHNPEITERRKGVLEKDLIVTPSLEAHIDEIEVIKVLVTLQTPEEVEFAKEVLEPFSNRVHLMWTHHPMTGTWSYGVITKKGISKLTASQEVAGILGVKMEDVLGIGDTFGDWIFMQDCGYAASVGERSPELQEKVKTKGEGHFFVAPSVDENGMVEILKKFDLI